MRSLVLLVFMIGIMFMYGGYIKAHEKCPPPRIEYRYIPRTFEEEQDDPVPLLNVFGKMFSNRTPWMRTQGSFPPDFPKEV